MADLGTARGRVIIDGSGVGRGLASASSGIDGFARKAVGLGAGLLGGYGIIRGIFDTINATASFEQRLSALRAVADTTGPKLAQLADQAQRLGQSTAFTAGEVVDAQTELVKAGASVEDVLGGALDSTLALAAAGEIGLAPAATLVANSLNQFNLRAAESTRVADILASTANTTATDVGQLAQAFQQGASAAKQVGLPIEDFTALLGAMAEEGVVGSDAGTSLKTALLALVAPFGRGAEAVKKYGLEFFDANGRIKGAAGLAEELRAKLGKLNPQQRTAALQAIAGRDGFRALAAAFDLGSVALTRNIKVSQQSGTAAETARVKQDNLRGDIEKLGGAIETLQIKAGGVATGGLRSLTQGATDLINAITDSEDLAAFGQDLIAIAQGGASAAAGLEPVARAALEVVGAVGKVIAGAASLGGAFLNSAAGARILQFAVVGLGAAFLTYQAAALAAVAATRALAIAQSVAAFASLARTVSSGADAMALFGAAFPALANPMAAAAAGVAVLAGGVFLLSTGMFSGGNAAAQLASEINAIPAATTAAANGINGLRNAIGGIKDAQLAERGSAIALKVAEADLAALRASGTATMLQLEQAEQRVAEARRQHNRDRAAAAQAEAKVTKASLDGAVGLGRLVTQIDRGQAGTLARINGLKALGLTTNNADGSTQDLARQLQRLDSQGAGAGQRMNVLRGFIRDAAASMDTSTKSGRENARILTQLGKADNAGIVRFARTLQEGLDAGLPRAKAVDAALKAIKPPKAVKLDAEDKTSPKAKSVTDALKLIPPKKTTTVLADTSNALARLSTLQERLDGLHDKSITVTIVPVHRKGSPTAFETMDQLERIGPRREIDVTFNVRGSGAIEDAVGGGGPLAQRASLYDRLAAQRAAFDARLTSIDTAEGERQQANERRRLEKAIAEAQQTLRKASVADRAEAQRSLDDAKAALAEFRISAGVEARKAAIGVRTNLIDGIQEGMGKVESDLTDIGSRLGEAIDRGLQAKLAGLGDVLKAKLAEIDASPEAQRITAIGTEIDAAQAARSAREAASQRGELTGTTTDAAALVAKRRASLARARTASEQQAAQALLDQALADQRKADLALSDFEEDQRIAALERERTALATGLQQRRDAAQTAHDDAATAAERDAAAQRAALDKQLGDLGERLKARKITWRQFNKELSGIVGSEQLRGDIERSGSELGLAFSRGLSRSITSAETAAEGMARAIAKYLRLRSPAETGPLAFDFRRSGRTLVNDLVAGMASRENAAARAAAGVAGALAFAARAGGGAALAVPTGTDAGFTQHNEFHIAGGEFNAREASERMAFEARFGGRA